MVEILPIGTGSQKFMIVANTDFLDREIDTQARICKFSDLSSHVSILLTALHCIGSIVLVVIYSVICIMHKQCKNNTQ